MNSKNNNKLSKITLKNVSWIKLNKKGLIEDPSIKLENKAAIYIYQFKNKSIFYVGSTRYLASRIKRHSYLANNGKKGCPKFYNFIRKYGWVNIKLGILEYLDISVFNIEDKHDIKKFIFNKEQYYLDMLNPYLNIEKRAGVYTKV